MSTPASTGSRRAPHDDAELAFQQDDAHHIVDLVREWGLARDAQRHAHRNHDLRLDFDGFDRAHADRTLADVWETSLTRSRR
jgi:hypothetical protein